MKYTGVNNMVRFIKDHGIETVITELAQYLEHDFKRWEEFDKTPRYASHSKGGVIELMPTSDGQQFGFKYVNGHPGNYKKDLQTVIAFGVLSEVETGYPILFSEMTIATALRTAAMSALVAKYLAKEGSKTMAMIGNGCQAEFQAHAFRALLGIDELRLYDIDKSVSEKMVKNLETHGFNMSICNSSQEAVKRADIITTCTADKKNATILSDNMVGAGVHINAIGGDCPGKTELHADILSRAKVFVEYEEQSRIEGEIQQMPEDFEVTELWQIFSGEKQGRALESDITVFDSVGFAVEDFSILRYLNDKIDSTDYYEELDLFGTLDDSRNLFGLLT
ncbi:MAG: ornithine cyclodeaminase [Alphaproteobacteria bacterium]|nr:ornithine cyclodeaminase [Alphaproteobacteria bacterium]